MSVLERPQPIRPTAVTRAVPVDTAPRARPGSRPGWSRAGVALTDAAVLVAAFVAAHAIRFPWELGRDGVPIDVSPAYLLVGAVIVALWLGMLAGFRTRDPRIAGIGGEEYRRVLVASLVVVASVAVVAYAARIDLARGYIAVAFPLGLLGLVLVRKAWRGRLARRRVAGVGLADVLLVGDIDDVRYVGRRVCSSPVAGYRVRGVVTDCVPTGDEIDLREGGDPTPVVGSIDRVVELAASAAVSAVVLAGSIDGGRERLRRLGWELEERGVELVVSSPLVDVAEGRVHHRPVDGLPLMHVETPDYTRRLGKRVLDVTGSAIGLVLLAPVLAVIALAIRSGDGGPVFFRQTRVGRGGAEFSILKFRTMAVDAEARMAELVARNEGAGPLFKMRDDPRVTRVGAFLRRTSLDELPQLWNVLVGSMSLVGPRPALPREVAAYVDFADRRLLVTPGITGLWQVSGRSDLDWAEGVRLDLHYVENWSFVHDLVILARTIPSVLRSRGAY